MKREKRVISDNSTTFGWHVPPIMKKETTKNKMTRQKPIFNNQESMYTLSNMHGGSKALIPFFILKKYFNTKSYYYPQSNLKLTKNPRLKTPNYKRIN